MKTFPKILSSLALVAAVSLVPFATQASGENVGDTQRCIYLPRINSSSAIDDSTILITMRGRGDFKRIDLRAPCSGLEHSGFNVRVHEDRICTSDSLTVRQIGGAVCMIEKIVTIDEAAATALRAK